VSLRLASGSTVAGAGEAALRALAKLDQVMPPRLRAEVWAVHGVTETLVGPGVEIDAELLVTLARACRDAVRVRFRYAGRDGGERERTVEPVRMVATGRDRLTDPISPCSTPCPAGLASASPADRASRRRSAGTAAAASRPWVAAALRRRLA
jgi:hypothetical protein